MSENILDINEILHPDGGAVQKEDFVVDTLEKVDWAVGKAALAEQRISDRSALVKEYKERLDKWLIAENGPDISTIEYMKGVTREFVTAEINKQGKKRSVSVPSGVAGLRKGSVVAEIQDEQKAIEYCKIHAPSAVKTKVTLDKAELKKLEAGDGFTIVTNPETYYIKPNTGLMPK